MEFRIEATKPTAPADLEAVLCAARDKWLESTEQVHDVDSAEHKALEEKRSELANAQLANDPTKPHTNGMLAAAAQRYRDVVKAQSAKLNAEHKGALALIDSGIQAAVVAASGSTVPVRCSVVGHFDVSVDGIRVRPAEAVQIHVNSAG